MHLPNGFRSLKLQSYDTAGAPSVLSRIRITDESSVAQGINDAGVIVRFTGSEPLGFVGSESRGFLLLVPPGGDAGCIVACEGITNARKVVCDVTDTAGNTRNFIGSPDD
jgi:hypothetical protein